MNIVASGLTVGFTGSYIFSQTIFTYRTGTNSRWVGIFVALSFLGVVLSTINVLQVTPLFFLGSTLIFIGTDLLFEWVSIVIRLSWRIASLNCATHRTLHCIAACGNSAQGKVSNRTSTLLYDGCAQAFSLFTILSLAAQIGVCDPLGHLRLHSNTWD